MKRTLRVGVRALYPMVLGALIVGHVLSFARFQDPDTAPPSVPWYAPLRLRESDALPRLESPRPLRFYLPLQQQLLGAELVVPRGVRLDKWSWKHLALTRLRATDVDRSVAPRARELLRGRARRVRLSFFREVLFLAESEELRGSRAYVLRDPTGADLYIVPEARLRELGEHLR